jgi:head-tail adaptor
MHLGLAEPVTVYRKASSPTTNPDGEQTGEEVFLQKRWAQIIPLRGRERDVGGQRQADVTHIVRMPSDARSREITAEHWLKRRNGTVLQIARAVDDGGRRDEIEFECNERT